MRHRLIAATMLMLPLVISCKAADDEVGGKPPRPVTVITLQKSKPRVATQVSGVASSWKTEELAFEVGGRVAWVLEPGKYVSGKIETPSGTAADGTALAQLDKEKYQTRVESAKADLEVAELNEEASRIRLEEALPAQLEIAESDFRFAQSEYDRILKLRDQSAASQSSFDDAANRLETARAQRDNLNASLNEARVDYAAAQARVRSAEQSLSDAHQDLTDTTLFSSFRGQISDVHVVPGSVVAAGEPILTLQMMDPIKIEIEVSAEQSRRIQGRRQALVGFDTPNGGWTEKAAMVYMIDPSADSTTHTFTVTLLVLNEQILSLAEGAGSSSKAVVEHIWPVDVGSILGVDDRTPYFESKSIGEDSQGTYVWIVNDALRGESLPESPTVRKAYVDLDGQVIPFLGNWEFMRGTLQDGEQQTKWQSLMIAGNMTFPFGRERWDGESIVLQSGPQWMLRPGDLVTTYFADGSLDEGWFVPVESILEESGATYVFVVQDGQVQKHAVSVEFFDGLAGGSTVRIESANDDKFEEGTQIVLGGVHFLKDGDQVKVNKSTSQNESEYDFKAVMSPNHSPEETR